MYVRVVVAVIVVANVRLDTRRRVRLDPIQDGTRTKRKLSTLDR